MINESKLKSGESILSSWLTVLEYSALKQVSNVTVYKALKDSRPGMIFIYVGQTELPLIHPDSLKVEFKGGKNF